MEKPVLLIPGGLWVKLSNSHAGQLERKVGEVQRGYCKMFMKQNIVGLLLLLAPIFLLANFVNFICVYSFGPHFDSWDTLSSLILFSFLCKALSFPRRCDMSVFGEDFWEKGTLLFLLGYLVVCALSIHESHLFAFAMFVTLDCAWAYLVCHWFKASGETVRKRDFKKSLEPMFKEARSTVGESTHLCVAKT